MTYLNRCTLYYVQTFYQVTRLAKDRALVQCSRLDVTLGCWGRVVSIATCYGLRVSGLKSQWGRDILPPSLTAPIFIQPPVKWVSVLLPDGKPVRR
jgi:hypothetical protein